ncbi:sugar 3,4-ketoisomerase [Sphingomonas arenae]|uniref:sugar 3,4-ketoisomerase n=1 Tax=Sphingomonas arenae TaxID=2812555 RepID=UPI0019681DD0|nr:FdtA/QdtA family cupin domain-containing protein [Sphingomonas arenae]
MTYTLPAGCALVDLAIRGDDRGSLIALEGDRNLPFAVARVYYVFGTKAGVSRGFHAHRKLNQLAVAVSGSCTMLVDDGSRRTALPLDRPDQGLLLGPMLWREMHDFSPDCVLLVMADTPYDESDYVRDYQAFLREVRAAA